MASLLRCVASVVTLFFALQASALNIALTNDDGWDAPGIQALRSALLAAGHKVTLAGSTENQSGSSAALDMGQGNLLVTKKFEDGVAAAGGDQYAVSLSNGSGAEPATAGQVALAIAAQAGQPVDLLLSGINAGANIGAFTNSSGTVGAVIQAISLATGSQVPAVAISTNEPQSLYTCPTGNETACEAANHAHYAVVANWMVGFLAELEKKPGKLKKAQGLLPQGIALNINYPVTDQVLGVRSSVQGLLPSFMGKRVGLPLACYGDCVGAPVGSPVPAGIVQPKPVDSAREHRHADTTAFEQGYVSIVVINTDLTASKSERKLIGKLVKNLDARVVK